MRVLNHECVHTYVTSLSAVYIKHKIHLERSLICVMVPPNTLEFVFCELLSITLYEKYYMHIYIYIFVSMLCTTTDQMLV